MMQSTTPADEQDVTVKAASLSNLKRERLRFSDFTFTRLPSGACTAEVALEWQDGVRVVGKASGQSSPLGDLRLAADAALRALEEFSEGALHFELIGVKLVRAFDENLVIVSIIKRGENSHARLIGCFLAPNDANRGAALAVMNATNRVLGNYLATR